MRELVLLPLIFVGIQCIAAQEKLPRFESNECPFERGDWAKNSNIECKRFLVPESPSNPKSLTIELSVVVIKASNPDGSPPLVTLHGGPGDSSIARTREIVISGFNKLRDIVLYDQRGSGSSRPKLCPEYMADIIRSQTRSTQNEKDKAFDQAVRKCVSSLDADGIDRSAYNTDASASDLIALREALGYPIWDVMGSSYGGRLAQLVMLRDSKAIRSVVLENPVSLGLEVAAEGPLSAQRAFERVFADCLAQPECANAFPKIEADFYEVYNDLQKTPVIVQMDSPDLSDVVVHGNRFINRVRNSMLGQPNRLTWLPLLINEFRRGDKKIAAKLLIGNRPQGPPQGDQVLVNLINCYDNYGKQFLDQLAATNSKVKAPFKSDVLGNCKEWQNQFARSNEATVFRSEIPTLITVGRYDDRTPVEHSRKIASRIRRAYVYEFPNEGHGTFPSFCRLSIMNQFIKDPLKEPDASCISKLPPIKFVTSWEQVPSARVVLAPKQ